MNGHFQWFYLIWGQASMHWPQENPLYLLGPHIHISKLLHFFSRDKDPWILIWKAISIKFYFLLKTTTILANKNISGAQKCLIYLLHSLYYFFLWVYKESCTCKHQSLLGNPKWHVPHDSCPKCKVDSFHIWWCHMTNHDFSWLLDCKAIYTC